MVALNQPSQPLWNEFAVRTAHNTLQTMTFGSHVVAQSVSEESIGRTVAAYQTMTVTLLLHGLLDNLRAMASPELQVSPLTDEQREAITSELLTIVDRWDGQNVGSHAKP